MRDFLADVLGSVAVEYADIRIEECDATWIVFRGRELDEVSRSLELGGCLRVFGRGNWGVATFNAVDETLTGLLQDVAAQVAALPARDEKLPALGPLDVQLPIDPKQDPRRVPLEEKHGLTRHYNEIMLAAPGIATTVSVYGDAYRDTVFYSTEERFIEQESVYTGFLCRAIARDGANIQEYSDGLGKTLGFESLKGREEMVERVAGVAIDLLRAEPVAAGRYDVIIDPLLAGVFCHEAFGHMSESDHICENEKLRELMKVGARFGVDELAIFDDATLEAERGSYRYDDEGAPAGRTELVRGGILVGHLHDRQTAARMGERPTGNSRAVSYRFAPIVRMSNTFIEPRGAKLEEMIESLERGLYVCGARGGATELESFTFASQYAYLVEKGRKTKMVRDATLSGNVFETMHNIAAIGDDLVIYGGLGGCGKGRQLSLPVGIGAPHVKVRNVVIGGK